jgi:hypothetical protein
MEGVKAINIWCILLTMPLNGGYLNMSVLRRFIQVGTSDARVGALERSTDACDRTPE